MTGSTSDLSGLVLCGGQSSRMGKDKGLLVSAGKPWAENTAELLNETLSGVFISLRRDQSQLYKKIFKHDQLIFDRDDITAQGPLRGLLSAHNAFAQKSWLVVACDMIRVNRTIIAGLVNAFSQNPGYDCYLYKTPQGLEPLCAIYSESWLGELSARVHRLYDFSLYRNLSPDKCLILNVDNENTGAFKNFNQPEDLQSQ